MSIAQWFGFASRSLRVRFLAALLLGAALVTAIGSYATYQVAQSHIQNQLVERSKLLASAINHSAMIAHSDADLQHVIQEVLNDNPDLRMIAVMLKDGQKVISSASADHRAFSKTEHEWQELVDTIGAGNFGFHAERDQALVLIAPLWHALPAANMAGEAGGQASAQSPRNPMPNRHHAMGGTPPAQGNNSGHNHWASTKSSWITQNLSASDYRGGILLRVDRSGVIAAMSNILWGLTPVSVIGVLAILALTYLLLHYQVIAPIGGIRRVMKRQQSGDRQARAEKQSSLELDEVATAFNRMIDTILESEEELISHSDYLQKRVNLATIHLKNKALELELALAKEKKLNKLQREFVSMASHEFRTPLAIIDTAAQRLKRRADSATPEEAVKRADKIRGAVKRMTRLMDSTLTAARMEEGKIRVEIKPCDIGKVVAEICAVQQEIAQTHVISYDLADLPETIQADIGSLEQVLTNLLSNAVKYALDAPDIEVKAGTKGDQVVISVRDHGIGIDEDELGRIGERFFRARTSTGTAGTGIGLNLAKTLVEMHGGTVSVESTKGEGSTFTVRLPIAGPEQTEQADTKAA